MLMQSHCYFYIHPIISIFLVVNVVKNELGELRKKHIKVKVSLKEVSRENEETQQNLATELHH